MDSPSANESFDTAETTIGVICASLPTMAPLVHFFKSKLEKSTQVSKGSLLPGWNSKYVRGKKMEHSENADDITLTTEISLEEGRTDR